MPRFIFSALSAAASSLLPFLLSFRIHPIHRHLRSIFLESLKCRRSSRYSIYLLFISHQPLLRALHELTHSLLTFPNTVHFPLHHHLFLTSSFVTPRLLSRLIIPRSTAYPFSKFFSYPACKRRPYDSLFFFTSSLIPHSTTPHLYSFPSPILSPYIHISPTTFDRLLDGHPLFVDGAHPLLFQWY